MKKVTEKRGEGKDIFCAIDLHDRKMLAGIAVDKGEVWLHEFDTTEAGGMLELVGHLQRYQRRHVGAAVHTSYEASGCGFRLSDFLEAHGYECWVLAPSRLPVSRKGRSEKTDEKDVRRILDVIRSHVLAGSDLPSVWKPPVELREDREIVRRRLELGDKITRVKNQIHGLLKRNGIRKPLGVENWSVRFMDWLERVAQGAAGGVGVSLRSLRHELEFYLDEEREVDREVAGLAKSRRYSCRVRALRGVKGVGLLSAMVFLTELGDLNRFGNRKALGNYLGLTPRSYESGEDDDHKGHISHLGPWRIRKVLNQCSWRAVQEAGYWRSWFLRRTEIAGLSVKKKKELRLKMITAVMRRLGIWLWRAGLRADVVPAAA